MAGFMDKEPPDRQELLAGPGALPVLPLGTGKRSGGVAVSFCGNSYQGRQDGNILSIPKFGFLQGEFL
jgi:predicted HAD superfamily phosphohydrolase